MTIRILQVVNSMNRAGLETMLMNYYRNINRDKIQFDFLTHRSFEGDYDKEIEKLGGRIYHAPRLYPQNYLEYFKFMSSFFKQHPEYKIVHSHIDSMSYLPLLAAKKANVPIRIAHSHNTSIDFDYKFILKEIFRFKIVDVANEFCACGYDAGKYLFRGKKNFLIIPNAIDKSSFIFNSDIRKKIRKKYKLGNQLVIGNVGRMTHQKNQAFLVKILFALREKGINASLILIGVGEEKANLEKLANKLNINKNILFLGKRNDVNDLYQAMDVFVMPSYYEGIPVVGIEAQFSGLPCLFSNAVPNEVAFNGKTKFLSLKKSEKQWANEICKMSLNERNEKERIGINNEHYDIKKAHNILENFYLDLYSRFN